MHLWLRLAAGIDRLSEWTGRLVHWFVLAMILLAAFNAVARYVGRYAGMSLASNLYLELQWYLFSLVFLLGAAYTLRHNAHVRVDVLYGRLSRRGRAWVNLVGTLLLLLPFCAFVIWTSWPTVVNAWAILEGPQDPGGLPRYPIKTAIPVGFALLLLQGVSVAIKQVALLRGFLPVDEQQSQPADTLREAI